MLKCHTLLSFFLTVLLVICAANLQAQKTLYVSVNSGDDSGNDCTDPNNPCQTILSTYQKADPRDIISIEDGIYTETIPLDKDIIIRGESAENTIVRAHEEPFVSMDEVFYKSGDSLNYLRISNLSIRNGAGIRVQDCRLEIENVHFFQNQSEYGAALRTTSCVGTINAVDFEENYATDKGGGVFSKDDSLFISKVNFFNNSSKNAGGGMMCLDSELQFRDVVFRKNHCLRRGGGLILISTRSKPNTPLYMTNVKFLENSSTRGGGLRAEGGRPWDIRMDSVVFEKNKATIFGGAIQLWAGFLTINNSIFRGNSSERAGGGAIWEDSHTDEAMKINNSIFEDNTCADEGCAIYVSSAVIKFSNLIFRNNRFVQYEDEDGGFGGAVYHAYTKKAGAKDNFVNCVFENNSTNRIGGAAYLRSDNFEFINCSFYGNKAGEMGGAIYFSAEAYFATKNNPKFKNVTIHDNSSDEGGGIYIDHGLPVFYNSIIWGNKADSSGNDLFCESYVKVYNSIYGHEPNDIFLGNRPFGSSFDIFDSFSADPEFVDPENGNLRLKKTSLAIEAGLPNYNLDDYLTGPGNMPIDLAGMPRLVNKNIDIGAYEFQEEVERNENEIYVGPNPNNGEFQIISTSAPLEKLEIYDLNGRRVFQSNDKRNVQNINLGNMPAGAYILRISTRNQIKVIKWIKI